MHELWLYEPDFKVNIPEGFDPSASARFEVSGNYRIGTAAELFAFMPVSYHDEMRNLHDFRKVVQCHILIRCATT